MLLDYRCAIKEDLTVTPAYFGNTSRLPVDFFVTSKLENHQ